MNLKSATYQYERLKQEFEKLGVEIEVLKNDYFCLLDENAEIVNNFPKCDFCIYLDKDEYMGRLLTAEGVRFFNPIDGIVWCDDKMMTSVKLKNAGVKIPKTISGLLLYNKNERIKVDDVKYIGETLGYPVVVKECFSSLGKGVYLANDLTELVEISEKLKCSKRIYQEFISSSKGKDIRIIVIGGKAFSSMLRKSETDFRSNVELGGKAIACEPSKEFLESAERASKALKLDYCGVDVLIGKNGEPIICEVNSNAFFGGMEEVSGKNVAKAYAEYVIKEIYG